MNQDMANNKINSWGVLLLLDVPKDIEFGIDNTSWKVGSKFKGVKLIPPGTHFAHYSLGSEGNQYKLGFFFHVSSSQRVFVRKWNKECEDFLSLGNSEEEERYRAGVDSFQFDQFLGPYDLERLPIWQECSNFITQQVIDTLQPLERRVHAIEQEYQGGEGMADLQKAQINSLVGDFIEGQTHEKTKNNNNNQDENKGSNKEKQQKQQGMQIEEEIVTKNNNIDECSESLGDQSSNEQNNDKQTASAAEQQTKENFRVMAGTIYYTEIPNVRTQFNLKGHDVTQLNLDKSKILNDYLQNQKTTSHEQLLRKRGNPTPEEITTCEASSRVFIFGEFQYAFVMLLLAEDFDSLEHWKSLLSIFLGSDAFMDKDPQFFVEFIPVLYNMLKQFPKDFFIDAITKDAFLKPLLNGFIEEGIQSQNKKLAMRAKKLSQLLEEHFLFFPKKTLLIDDKGQYMFDQADEDAPQIVDESAIEYF